MRGLASWVGGRARSELGRRTGSAEGLDRSWGGELGLWWMGLCRSAMEEKRETQREDVLTLRDGHEWIAEEEGSRRQVHLGW